MSITLEEFQKDPARWLARMQETGESLLLIAGRKSFEVRSAPPPPPEQALRELQKLLPKRDIIVRDPEELVHLDWSSEWRP